MTVDGNPIKLTSLEYRLLAYLGHHKGRVVARGELVELLPTMRPPPMPISAVYPSKRLLPPRVRAVLEALSKL